MNRDTISRLLLERLQPETNRLRAEFDKPQFVPTRYFVMDDVLPPDLAQQVFAAFPPVTEMRLLKSFREWKYTSKTLDRMEKLIAEVTFAFQSPEVIQTIATITSFRDMVGDPHLYAGGISAMVRGQFLNPHIDNSHDSDRRFYRVLNLLYYVSPNWCPENGGNLELWDDRVKKQVEIPSLFNRLVIMETHARSWHSVNLVKTGQRCCVSNYYFSPHPPGGNEHFHITSFNARPEQPVRRAITQADTAMRTLLRKAIKQGIGRHDLYNHSI